MITNINFGKYIYSVEKDKNGTTQTNIDNEIYLMAKAKKAGVSTLPKITTITYSALPVERQKPEIVGYSYQIKGKKADFVLNPITKKHFNTLFNMFYLMDKQGIYHNDLDIGHVFYSDRGKVETDFFRFGLEFVFNNTAHNKNDVPFFPEFMMPSNAINYEKASLGYYLRQTKGNDDDTNAVVKDYLESSADYHQKRLKYLVHKNAPEEMIEFERLQSEFLKRPSADIIELRKNRIDFLNKERLAFTEWDEGNGSCGHEKDLKRQINSIKIYIAAIRSAISYIKKADELKKSEINPDKKKYFEYEKQFGEYWLSNYENWAAGMVNYLIQDKEKMNESDEIVQKLSGYFEEIKKAEINDKNDKINQYQRAYAPIAQKHL